MKIAIIIGSTRNGRVGIEVASWVKANLVKSNFDFELVDLKEWNLPFFQAAELPSTGIYGDQLTKDWSKKISEMNGFIFVTSEYNAGYPAALKNAIDFLNKEWTDKSAMIVSYGVGGGTSSQEQLKQVLTRLKMKVNTNNLAITITREIMSKDPSVDFNKSFSSYIPELQNGQKELETNLA